MTTYLYLKQLNFLKPAFYLGVILLLGLLLVVLLNMQEVLW